MINNPNNDYVYIKVRKDISEKENFMNHLKIIGYGALFGVGSVMFTYFLVYLIVL